MADLRQFQGHPQWLFDPATGELGFKNRRTGEDRVITSTANSTSGGGLLARTTLAGGIAGLGNRAPEIRQGRMGTYNNPGNITDHLVMVLPQLFDTIEIIYACADQSASDYILLPIVSVMANLNDPNNSGGAWVGGTFSGSSYALTPVAQGASRRPSFLISDPITIAALPRDDGGAGYPLAIRSFTSIADSAQQVAGDGVQSFTNWATRQDGRVWIARRQAVDGVTTPANFTSTTNVSQSPIIGVIASYRGKVVSTMAIGDSSSEGQGTYIGEGYGLPAATAMSNPQNYAFGYANLGWSGQSASGKDGYFNRLLDVLQTSLRPNIVVMPIGSGNDISTTITAAKITEFRNGVERCLAACAAAGVTLVLATWYPSNSSSAPTIAGSRNYGATDALRRAYNDEVRAWGASRGVVVLDVDAQVTSAAPDATGQYYIAAGLTADSVHLNDAGNALVSAALVTIYKTLLGV